MSRIKTRETVKDIKTLDKAAVASERMKSAFVRLKDQAENLIDDGQISPQEYAQDKIRYAAEDAANQAGNNVGSTVRKGIDEGKRTFREHRQESRLKKAEKRVDRYEAEFRKTEQAADKSASQTTRSASSYAQRKRNQTIKTSQRKAERTIKQSARSVGKQTVKTGTKGTVKSTRKSVKTAEKTSRAAVKTAEATAKAAKKAADTSAKAARKAAEAARQAAAAAQKAAVLAAKAVAAAIKAIVAGIAKLVAAIAAGGWVAVVVIVIICLIALIVCSCYGIFFSNDSATGSEQTIQSAVREINEEYTERIDLIKEDNPHDDLEMSGSRADWSEILSVYAVKATTDPDNPQEVVTMTDEKKQLLSDIFWDMNDISYTTRNHSETVTAESDDGNGNLIEKQTQETKTTLHIVVSHRTAAEMAAQYNFSDEQNKMLTELLNMDSSVWATVLYGVYSGDDMIVQIALSQVGNVGGQPYWSWYGFGRRVEWCACFVSWCADQCGYIESGVMPKYAGVGKGVQWFKDRGQWADGSIEPAPGMIIFFDWDNAGGQDGNANHTGIVYKVEDGFVYTIEGNSGDRCVINRYRVGHYEILGYGAMR